MPRLHGPRSGGGVQFIRRSRRGGGLALEDAGLRTGQRSGRKAGWHPANGLAAACAPCLQADVGPFIRRNEQMKLATACRGRISTRAAQTGTGAGAAAMARHGAASPVPATNVPAVQPQPRGSISSRAREGRARPRGPFLQQFPISVSASCQASVCSL